MIGSRTVTLRFSVNWLIGIFVIAALLIAAFIWGADSWHPTLIFTAAVLAGSGTLMVAANALDTRVAGLLQAKKAAAIDFVNRWNDPQFFHAKKNGREIIKEMKRLGNPGAQKTYLEEDTGRLANLIDVLNVFENLSVAIQTDVVDEEVTKRFFKSILLEYWHICEGFIEARRAERQNTRLSLETEWLFNRWKG